MNQWLAESPNRKVKVERKGAIAKDLLAEAVDRAYIHAGDVVGPAV